MNAIEEKQTLDRLTSLARRYFGIDHDANPVATIEQLFDCLAELAGMGEKGKCPS